MDVDTFIKTPFRTFSTCLRSSKVSCRKRMFGELVETNLYSDNFLDGFTKPLQLKERIFDS